MIENMPKFRDTAIILLSYPKKYGSQIIMPGGEVRERD